MAIVRKTLDPNRKLTKKQKKELEEAAKHPIVFDDDLPDFSIEELKAMAEAARIKLAEKAKQTQ